MAAGPPGRRGGGPGAAGARGGASGPALLVLLLAAGAGARAEAWGGERAGGARAPPEAPARLHLVSHAPFPHDGLAAALVQDFSDALGLRGAAGLGEGRRQTTRRDSRGGPRGEHSLCNSLLGPHCRDLTADAVLSRASPVRDAVREIGREVLLDLERGKGGNAVVLFTHQQSMPGTRLMTALDPLQSLIGTKATVHFMDCSRNLDTCAESRIRQVPELVLYQAAELPAGRPHRGSLKTFFYEAWDLIETEADASRVASELAAFTEDYLRQGSYMPPVPSRNTQIMQTMTVVNRCATNVNILWMDYENSEVLYFVLIPGEEVTTTSFASHVWNARSVDDRELIGQWSVQAQTEGVPYRVEVEPGMSKRYESDSESESESEYEDSDSEYEDYESESESSAGGGGVKALEKKGNGEKDYADDLVGEVIEEAEGDVEMIGLFAEGAQFDEL